MGRTGRPTVIGVAAAHLCRCKVNVCSCIYSVLASATNTPYSDNIVFASAYVGGSLPSVFTQLWESRVVSAKGMFAAVVLQLQVFAAATVRNSGIDCQWLLAGRSCSKGRLTKGYTAYIYNTLQTGLTFLRTSFGIHPPAMLQTRPSQVGHCCLSNGYYASWILASRSRMWSLRDVCLYRADITWLGVF